MSQEEFDSNRVQIEAPELPYEINEELKLLRTNLQFCGTDKKVICITSAVASEGKSTTVLNLCRSICETGKTVLLIDADLRRSVLRAKIEKGRPTHNGDLTHYLSGLCGADEAICETQIEGLDIIFTMVTPPNPSELLGGTAMQRLLTAARKSYDYVIVDTPPLGMVVDAAVIAQYCDGSVLLISSGDVSYRVAQDVEQKLQNTKCPILGVVLNKVDHRKNGKYYGKTYGKYYGEKYGGYY